MSRRQLLTAARLLKLPTEARRDGKRSVRDSDWLRSDILTRTYGPGLQCLYASPDEADAAILNAARCEVGELGESLRDAQKALRAGMGALRRWRNATYYVPRELDAEHKHLATARGCFELARQLQEAHIAA